MKYKFGKCTSAQIGGIVRRKRDGIIFDTESKKWKGLKAEIEALHKSGHLEIIKESEKEVKVEAEVELKAKVEVKAEPKKVEAKAKSVYKK